MDNSYDRIYNRHIRLARRAAQGTFGYERAKAIWQYFETTNHPHPRYTFEQAVLNRTSDHQFPIDLMKDMANLCAINEAYCERS